MPIGRVLSLDGPIGRYDVVCLAPRLQDAVLACASHLRQQRRLGKEVLVVAAFSDHEDATSTLNTPPALSTPFLSVEDPIQEDALAMRDLDVDYHYLNLQDTEIRKSLISKRRCLFSCRRSKKKQLKQLEFLLVQQLRKIVAKSSCHCLIGPAAIGFDPSHLAVHRACAQVGDQVAQALYYCDFPQCTRWGFAQLRRLTLRSKWSLRDVEVNLTPEEVVDRRKLIDIYASQTEAYFGSERGLDVALETWPREHFFEVRRAGDTDAGGRITLSRLLPTAATLLLPQDAWSKSVTTKLEYSKELLEQESPVAVYKRILVFDIVISLLAFLWLHYGMDGGSFGDRAIQLAYAVVCLAFVRVFCLASLPSGGNPGLLFFSSMCVAAVAFSFTAGVRCVTLAVYYSMQVFLGYLEQKLTNLLKREHKVIYPLPCLPYSLLRRRESSTTTSPVKDVKNVLMISDYMPPQTHGISTHTDNLIHALRDYGCKVHCYTSFGEADEAVHLNWPANNPFNPDPSAKVSLFPSCRLIATILGGDWDVVHIICPNVITWPVCLTAWVAGKPIYVSQHVNEALGKLYVNTCSYYAGQLLYFFWSRIAVCLFATIDSAPTYGYMLTHPVMKRLSPQRLAVVPSSVDDKRFHSRDRESDRAALQGRLGIDSARPIWLLVSRLAPEKDVAELLEALKFHRQRCPVEASSPVLVIAGDGPLRKELENHAMRDKLPVHFLGMVPNAHVAGLYRACDVCVTNSIHETFGLTTLESLSCGCPIVMPHCPVFDELYGDVLSAWMYQKGDVESLADAMVEGSKPEGRERIASLRRDNGFSPNLFWSWKDAAEEQMSQYKRCLSMVRSTRRRRNFILTALVVCTCLATMGAVMLVSDVPSPAAAGRQVWGLFSHPVQNITTVGGNMTGASVPMPY